MKKFILTFLAFLFGGTFFSNSLAQIEFGADLYSRYIWRGVDYGNSPSFQPALSFTAGGFTVGTWGAYSFAGEGNVFSEHDIFAQYSFETGAGTFGVIFTDYYYPSAGLEFFNYEGEGTGAHVLEAGLSYTGPGSFPIAISGFYNIHNDPDKSTYVQIGYPFQIESVELAFFAGASGGESAWYGTTKAALINVGFSASKEIKITDSFSLPVNAAYILNPDLEQSYLIFGINL
jgi:hypothetical protein